MGDKEGPPGLGLSSDRRRTSALGPACEPPSLGEAPGIPGEPAAQQREATKDRERASNPLRGDTMDVDGHRPMTSESSAEAPDSSAISSQLPSSAPPFAKTCAPSQTPTMRSGCLDHVSYEQLHVYMIG